MAKKVLLALDNSKNSLEAVKYVAGTIPNTATVTMLSILPDPVAACELGDNPTAHPLFKGNTEAFCAIEHAKKSAMEGFMEEAKKLLVKAGFPSKNVSVRIKNKKTGIARDIVKEAERGKYDTLVMGRRGVSGIKQFFMGSVSNKVLQLIKNVSVIVVD